MSQHTRILVINHDTATAEILKDQLGSERFDIINARFGEVQADGIFAYHPDVIILDMFSPSEEAFNFCSAIRLHSHTPILVLSALNKPDLLSQMLDRGADDFLLKPVANGVLIAHLNTLARRAQAENRASGRTIF